MTEITAKFVFPERRALDRRGFGAAVAVLPVLLGTLSVWSIFPATALLFTLVVYGALGAILFAVALRHIGPHPVAAMLAGAVANLLAYPLLALGLDEDVAMRLTRAGVAIVPPWGLIVGDLYRRLADR